MEIIIKYNKISVEKLFVILYKMEEMCVSLL